MQYLSTTEVKNKAVLVRLDLDLPETATGFDTTRLEDGIPTLCYLWKHHAKHVTVIAHRGHSVSPAPRWSLAPIAQVLYTTLLKQTTFGQASQADVEAWLDVLENLRFDPREEAGSVEFAKELTAGHDLFVNDAFATSHREHTSITVVPTLLPTVFGFQFEKELEALDKLIHTPKRPFMLLLGGAKLETKLPLLKKMMDHADVILLGGKLAAEARNTGLTHRKMIVAELTPDGLDITPAAAEQFERFVTESKTLVWNGPMGKFEDKAHEQGTAYVAAAVSRATAYTVIGGGDTEAALTKFGLDAPVKNHHISAGGGAMLHYLTYHTLPALEVVESKK